MHHLKQFFRLLLTSILFWPAAFCLFICIRFVGYGEEQSIYQVTNDLSFISGWLHFGLLLGVVIGIPYAIIEFLFEKNITKNLYLGLVILLKTIIYFLILMVSFLFLIRLIEIDLDRDLPNKISWWLLNDMFWLATVYFFICLFIFQFVKLTTEKFGKGVLLNSLFGKYRNPIEENRLFMFIDLQSSTSLAEKLGHYKYSQLIQDCFFDLNKVLRKYNAEIYQYVGDEAVISWSFNEGIKNNRCLDLYFHFIDLLHKRSKYYTKSYGTEPFFKAGVHGGKLMVAEVGMLKKELAYHGDVINTTARIQGQCNIHNQSCLISEDVLSVLQLNKKYTSSEIGDLLLKGKQETLKILAINKA
ncbi:adenylate/guanylate cyclase domain-containing protein [uncultured Algibacter sp.]|uniref:adenylate/guanylate cyclase domain-containing protein n=1 Tax=uncultured Algibacter sp. TaxID=298659 RepID=UPI0032167EAC